MAKAKIKMTKTALQEVIERADAKYGWRHYQEFLNDDEFGWNNEPCVVPSRTRHYANGYMNALYEFFEKYIPICDTYLDRHPITKKSLMEAVKLAEKEVARIRALQRVHPKTEFYAAGYRDALWELEYKFFPEPPRKRQKVKTGTKRTAKKTAKKASKSGTKKTTSKKRAPR